MVKELPRSADIMHVVRWPTSDMHPIKVGLDLRDATAGRHRRRKGDEGSRNACMRAFTEIVSLGMQTCVFP